MTFSLGTVRSSRVAAQARPPGLPFNAWPGQKGSCWTQSILPIPSQGCLALQKRAASAKAGKCCCCTPAGCQRCLPIKTTLDLVVRRRHDRLSTDSAQAPGDLYNAVPAGTARKNCGPSRDRRLWQGQSRPVDFALAQLFPSWLASWAMASIAAQLPASTRSPGATQLPPAQTTLGRLR